MVFLIYKGSDVFLLRFGNLRTLLNKRMILCIQLSQTFLIFPVHILVPLYFCIIPCEIEKEHKFGIACIIILMSKIAKQLDVGKKHIVSSLFSQVEFANLFVRNFFLGSYYSPKASPPPEPEWSEQVSDVNHLTNDNFDSFLAANRKVLVMFYAPCELLGAVPLCQQQKFQNFMCLSFMKWP